ncbi:MAG: glycosyltransferase family 9 protein [bacterium]
MDIKTLIPNTISRILLSRLRFMGDVILTTPIIRQLRHVFPNAYIAYLTEDKFAPLLQNNPLLDEIIPLQITNIQHKSSLQALKRQAKFIRDFRAKKFDLAIDLFGNPRTALLTWLSGARWRVGGDFRGRGLLYNLRVQAPVEKLDAIAFHQLSLQKIGLEADSKKTEIFLADNEIQSAQHYLERKGFDLSQPIVGLHPGASWPNKCWQVEYFKKLAQELLAEQVQIFVSCGPGEQELLRPLQEIRNARLVFGEVLPLRQLAAVLRHLNLYITNDCGVMHLAVAVDTPTFGIFGPGEPNIWFPYRKEFGHKAFWADIECRPCHKNECPLGTLACMHETTPEMVFKEAMHFLTWQI